MTEDKLKNLDNYDERTRRILTDLFRETEGDSRKMAGAINIHISNITKIYNATYSGDLETYIDRAEAWLRRRRRVLANIFIEGETARNIFNTLNRVRDQSSFALITGASRRGKTHTIKEWCARNSDGIWKPIYIECPSDKSTLSLVVEIAKAMRIGANGSKRQIVERIEDKLNAHYILIFDEATRLLQRGDPSEVLETIRRFHDQRECGICFLATPWFEGHLTGGKNAIYLEQLVGRLDDILRIPKEISRGEVRKFLAPYCRDKKVPEDLMKLATTVARQTGKVADLQRHINDALLLARAVNRDHLDAELFVSAIEQRKGVGLWSEEG